MSAEYSQLFMDGLFYLYIFNFKYLLSFRKDYKPLSLK
jgi:hypothetical protein